jgi:predicted metal-dependent peptidase
MILGYNPKWAVTATVEELAADIVHEVNHFKRRHFLRSEGVEDLHSFNLAGDLSINPDMKAAGWKLAEGGEYGAIFPKMFGFPEGLSTEEYYSLLLKKKNEGGGGDKPEPKPASDDVTSGTLPSPKPGSENEEEKPGDEGRPNDKDKPSSGEKDGGKEGQGGGRGQNKGHVCRGNCGGIAGNPTQAELEKKLDSIPDLGRSEAEMKGIEKRLADSIAKHMEQNGRGSVPNSLHEWTKVLDDESHIRWEDELSQILRDTTGRLQAGGDDFSLRRPSKRSIMRGFLRPGLVEYLPEVAIIRDSSASMREKQLNAAVREAYGVMRALGIDDVWFTDADTQVAVPWKRVRSDFFLTLKEAHGRGGTSFNQPIESALQLFPRPDLILYCTDGDGSVATMPPPDVAVVWCIVPSHYNKAPARWGHTVIISEDKKVRKKGVVYPTAEEIRNAAKFNAPVVQTQTQDDDEFLV